MICAGSEHETGSRIDAFVELHAVEPGRGDDAHPAGDLDRRRLSADRHPGRSD
jgi:hypothetical protein